MSTSFQLLSQQDQLLICNVAFDPEIGNLHAVAGSSIQVARQVGGYRRPVRRGCPIHGRSTKGPHAHLVATNAGRRVHSSPPGPTDAPVIVNVLPVPIGNAPNSERNVNGGALPSRRFFLPELARPRGPGVYGACTLL